MTHSLQDGTTDPTGRQHYGRYRHVSRAAVVSVVFGGLSILTPLGWTMGLIPATGIGLAWWALLRIHENPRELTGRTVALVGLWVSVVLWAASYGWLTFRTVQRVPYGYTELTYTMMQPDPKVRLERIPPAIYEFQDKKVFVSGFMQPARKHTGLKAFILSPSVHDCPSCIPNPMPTEMIQVELEGDLQTRYTTHEIGIGGKFTIEPDARNRVPYRLKADYLK